MGILDSILGGLGENSDVANLAAKVGLSPEHIEMAVKALAKLLNEIIGHIGGEGALGRYASMLGAEGGLGDIASNIFGGKS